MRKTAFAAAAALVVFAAIGVTSLAGESAVAPSSPDDWQFVTVRAETAPRSSVVRDDAGGGTFGLSIAGNGSAISDGRWVKRLPLPADSHYLQLTARYRASNIEMPARNVVAALVWLDDAGHEVGNVEFAPTTVAADAKGWHPIDATYPVPPKAKQVRIELRLRWSPQGQVELRDAQVKPVAAPAPRKVKVASRLGEPTTISSRRLRTLQIPNNDRRRPPV